MQFNVSGHVFYIVETNELYYMIKQHNINGGLYTNPEIFSYITQFYNYSYLNLVDYKYDKIYMLYVDSKRYQLNSLLLYVKKYIEESPHLEELKELAEAINSPGEIPELTPDNYMQYSNKIYTLYNKVKENQMLELISTTISQVLHLIYDYYDIPHSIDDLELKVDMLCKHTRLINLIRKVNIEYIDFILNFIAMIAIDYKTKK